jgi:hypothetical protein
VVQRAQRLLESVNGGAIIITSEAYEALDYNRLENGIFAKKYPKKKKKTICKLRLTKNRFLFTETGHETTYLIVPKGLEERLAPKIDRENLPYAVIDMSAAPGHISARGLTKSASKRKEKV